MNLQGFPPPPKLPVGSYHQHLAVDVARHEAGHYVVGRALGLSMGKISVTLIDLQGGHRGTSAISPVEELSDKNDLIDWLGKRVKQLYAGVWAQSLGCNGQIDAARANDFAKSGGQDDYGRAQLLVHIMRNISHKKPASRKELEEQLMGIHQPLWDEAARLVQDDAPLIIALGDALGGLVKWTNEEYTFTEEYLLSMSAIQDRFPDAIGLAERGVTVAGANLDGASGPQIGPV